ncbi:MAG: hypothetical protein Q7J15_13205 [Candidatus Desulfaltia sp.]|nr:hypothetical protein [Candidatus Desulfaltia sp.]
MESRNWGEMKRGYELDVYKLAGALSDMVWHDFDKWNKKVQAKFPIPIVQFQRSVNGYYYD